MRTLLFLNAQSDPAILENFKPGGKLSTKQAFQIYHGIYEARLTEVLLGHFPAVLQIKLLSSFSCYQKSELWKMCLF